MYLRNVKQILRAAGFDERKYGFGGLTGPAEGLSARRAGASRARSTRRPACVPGPVQCLEPRSQRLRRRCRCQCPNRKRSTFKPMPIRLKPNRSKPRRSRSSIRRRNFSDARPLSRRRPRGRVASGQLRRESLTALRRAEAGQKWERGRRAARAAERKRTPR